MLMQKQMTFGNEGVIKCTHHKQLYSLFLSRTVIKLSRNILREDLRSSIMSERGHEEQDHALERRIMPERGLAEQDHANIA